jgi:hypothetical protein
LFSGIGVYYFDKYGVWEMGGSAHKTTSLLLFYSSYLLHVWTAKIPQNGSYQSVLRRSRSACWLQSPGGSSNSILLIFGGLQGIKDKQLRPRPIQILNIITMYYYVY